VSCSSTSPRFKVRDHPLGKITQERETDKTDQPGDREAETLSRFVNQQSDCFHRFLLPSGLQIETGIKYSDDVQLECVHISSNRRIFALDSYPIMCYDSCAMDEAATAIIVLVRALVLAQGSGASEIGTDHLLAALDSNEPIPTAIAGIAEPYSAVPKQDMPLALDAIAAISPLGDLSTVSLDTLRSALVSAKRQGDD
jgi:hypothetical protein